MKVVFGTFFLLMISSSLWATNYFDKNETCLKKEDILNIQNHFKQLDQLTATAITPKVCKGEGVSEKWFEIARSLLAMERLELTDVLKRDLDDDLTLGPVTEKNWWKYFTERANRFVIETSYCNRNAGVIAFVNPYFGRGEINLCPRFFEMDPASQIEVLMHEVRHFEGYSHVTCTQGNEKGNSGACDNNIKTGGSYAVGVQVQVQLSFVSQLSRGDRLLAESGAIYAVNNKFNSIPKVKSYDSIYLANEDGEIYRANAKNLSQINYVTTLKSPARIFANGSQFTIFPLDTSKNAYRVAKNLITQVNGIGAFANRYNAEAWSERENYGAVNYYGDGAIAKGDTLYSFCGKNASELSSLKFSGGVVKSIVNLKNDKNEDQNYVLSESGELYTFTCDLDTGKLDSVKTDRYMIPRESLDIFAVSQNRAFILTDNGDFMSLNLKSGVIFNTSLPHRNWVSATPLKEYNVFDSAEN